MTTKASKSSISVNHASKKARLIAGFFIAFFQAEQNNSSETLKKMIIITV